MSLVWSLRLSYPIFISVLFCFVNHLYAGNLTGYCRVNDMFYRIMNSFEVIIYLLCSCIINPAQFISTLAKYKYKHFYGFPMFSPATHAAVIEDSFA